MDQKKKILLVEDEKLLLDMTKSSFEKAGFEVFLAMNGEEGLKEFESHNPDILVVDLNMPLMDGFEMLEKLRKMPKGKTVPVIIFTNSEQGKDILKSAESHIDHYLVKVGWTPSELVKKVNSILDERKKSFNISVDNKNEE